jgi:hypothetical protein
VLFNLLPWFIYVVRLAGSPLGIAFMCCLNYCHVLYMLLLLCLLPSMLTLCLLHSML